MTRLSSPALALVALFHFGCDDATSDPDPPADESKPLVALVLVESGAFLMGADTADATNPDETPRRETIVSSFLVAETEITQSQWRAVLGAVPAQHKGDDLPVEFVEWFEAVEFCNELSEREGLEPCYRVEPSRVECDFDASGYRLPTEAEWEYAARGGAEGGGFRYAGADSAELVANFLLDAPRPVGEKLPNELGVYDMSGNVKEWCWDFYRPDYYRERPTADPRGPETGLDGKRVARGGGWMMGAEPLLVWNREPRDPYSRCWRVGFRVVRRAD